MDDIKCLLDDSEAFDITILSSEELECNLVW